VGLGGMFMVFDVFVRWQSGRFFGGGLGYGFDRYF